MTQPKKKKLAPPPEPEPEMDPESLFAASLDDRLREVRRHGRVLPGLALFALAGLFLSCGAGVAFTVVAVRFSLRVAGDGPSRVVVFAASVVGLLYVVVHVWASRTRYAAAQQGPPWIYGRYLHSAALLLSRLGFALWIAAIVTTSLLLATIGISFKAGLRDQTIYLNLVICAVAL